MLMGIILKILNWGWRHYNTLIETVDHSVHLKIYKARTKQTVMIIVYFTLSGTCYIKCYADNFFCAVEFQIKYSVITRAYLTSFAPLNIMHYTKQVTVVLFGYISFYNGITVTIKCSWFRGKKKYDNFDLDVLCSASHGRKETAVVS